LSKQRKTVAFFPKHPAQIWVMYPLAREVSRFANVVWAMCDKDCSLDLADSLGLEYEVLSKTVPGLVRNGINMVGDISRAVAFARRYKVDLWVTKYGAGNIAALLTGSHSIAFNDDDADIVPLIAWTSYTFADFVVVPTVTRMGWFDRKAIRYAGNHELFYLHPNRFSPEPGVLRDLGLKPAEPFAIIRLSALQAHHDIGIRGIREDLVRQVIRMVGDGIRLFISSEKPLRREFERFRFPIAPEKMHHALAFAEFFLGDSQTMTSESAVLGTPAFRLSDFVGKLSYIEELQGCGLAFGFKPGQEAALLDTLQNMLAMSDRKAVFAARRKLFLATRIDPVPWFAGLIRQQLAGESFRQIAESAASSGGLQAAATVNE